MADLLLSACRRVTGNEPPWLQELLRQVTSVQPWLVLKGRGLSLNSVLRLRGGGVGGAAVWQPEPELHGFPP